MLAAAVAAALAAVVMLARVAHGKTTDNSGR